MTSDRSGHRDRDGVVIRPVTAADAPLVLELVRELARFERAPPDAVRATADDYARELASDRPGFGGLIALVDGRPAGLALFHETYSTWEGRRGLHLEDLYLRDRARGRGLGRRLLRELARLAVARGLARLDLRVLDWNPARAFYERHGLRPLDGWLPYRADADALARLAGEGGPP